MLRFREPVYFGESLEKSKKGQKLQKQIIFLLMTYSYGLLRVNLSNEDSNCFNTSLEG